MRFAPKIMLKTQKLAEIAQIEVLTKMDFSIFQLKWPKKSKNRKNPFWSKLQSELSQRVF